MGLFKSLFGINSSSHEKLQLQDDQLGTFTALNNDGDRMIWKGSVTLLGAKVPLFINGNKKVLDSSAKISVQNILNDERAIELEIDRSLEEQYENAGKKYLNWKTHFNCVAISATTPNITITMEEKETYYNFNIQFEGNKATDITIDS